MSRFDRDIVKFICWLSLIGIGLIYGIVWHSKAIIGENVFASLLAAIVAFSNMALFWSIVFVFFIVVSMFYEDDWLWTGIFFFVLPLALLFVLFNGITLPSLSTVLLFSVVYLLVGFVWSFVKWLLIVSGLRNAIEGVIKNYKPRFHGESVNWNDLTDNQKGVYIYDYLHHDEKRNIVKREDFEKLNFAPKLVNNKARVTRWILYWPLSFLNYLFVKFLKDLIEAILNKLHSLYDSLSRWMMGNLKV